MASIQSAVRLSLLAFAIDLARPLPVLADDAPRLEIHYPDLEDEARDPGFRSRNGSFNRGPSPDVARLSVELNSAFAPRTGDAVMTQDANESVADPKTQQSVNDDDYWRARRGKAMTALGVPLMGTGLGAFVWLGAASPRNDCGYDRPSAPYVFGGVAMSILGVGFSSWGIVSLRRSSPSARALKSRGTRAATAAAAVFGTILGGLGLTGVRIGNAFCSD